MGSLLLRHSGVSGGCPGSGGKEGRMSETAQVQMVQEASIEQQSPCAEASDLNLDVQVSEEILARIEAGLTEEGMAAWQCHLSSPFFG